MLGELTTERQMKFLFLVKNFRMSSRVSGTNKRQGNLRKNLCGLRRKAVVNQKGIHDANRKGRHRRDTSIPWAGT